MHCAETRLAPGLLSYLSGVRVVSWLLPQGTGAHSPFMPGDATAVFPGVLARAVVFRASFGRIHSTGIGICPAFGWLSCAAFLSSSPINTL